MSEPNTQVDQQASKEESSPPPKWRVEGVDNDSSEGSGSSKASFFQPMRRRTFWLVLATLLVINWIVASSLLLNDERLRVPYTVFVEESREGQRQRSHFAR